jgi:CheY-like chemotaxis protein
VKQGLQILIVDDEAMVRRSIKLLLEHDGHKVWPVDDAEGALAQLAERKFDLIITDFSLPGMKGDELVARIRQLDPTQPIIMATAFVEEYEIFGQVVGPVDALLFKPFSIKELRDAIEQALPQEPLDPTGALPPAMSPPAPSFILPPQP